MLETEGVRPYACHRHSRRCDDEIRRLASFSRAGDYRARYIYGARFKRSFIIWLFFVAMAERAAASKIVNVFRDEHDIIGSMSGDGRFKMDAATAESDGALPPNRRSDAR